MQWLIENWQTPAALAVVAVTAAVFARRLLRRRRRRGCGSGCGCPRPVERHPGLRGGGRPQAGG